MLTKTYEIKLRLPGWLTSVLKRKSKQDGIDEYTALRELIWEGSKPFVLEQYIQGKISLSKAAELLDMSVYDILRILKNRDLKAGASEQQRKQSRATLEKFLSFRD